MALSSAGSRRRAFPSRKITHVGRSVVRALPIRNAARDIDMRALKSGSKVPCKKLERRVKAFAVEACFVDGI